MTTLISLRALVRRDLKDEDAANYRWTDAEIDRAIDKALSDYSLRCPLQELTELATVINSTNVDISTLTDLIDITRVEHPITTPPYPSHTFSFWKNKLLFLDGHVGDGTNCYVYWLKRHTLGATSSIPTAHETVIAIGAAAYALSSLAQYQTDKANTGGPKVDNDYSAWAKEMFTRFDKELSVICTYNNKKIKFSSLSSEES